MYVWCIYGVYTCITGVHRCIYGNKGVYRVYKGCIKNMMGTRTQGGVRPVSHTPGDTCALATAAATGRVAAVTLSCRTPCREGRGGGCPVQKNMC